MKKIAIITFITIGLISCVSNTEEIKELDVQNALIPQELLVDYAPLIERDSAYGISLNAYQNNKFDIVDFVFDKVLSEAHKVNESYMGEITNYKNDSVILALEDIKRVLGMGPFTLSYMKDGEEVFETYENDFVKEEIVRISFVENWHLDENNFKLTKEVLRYDFVRAYMREAEGPKFHTKVFGILKNDSVKSRWKFIGSKVTEANISVLSNENLSEMSEDFKEAIRNDFVSLDHEGSVYWNTFTYSKLVNAMFKVLKSGNIKAFDLVSNNELDWNQVRERMGAGIKTISYIDENGDEVTKTIEMKIEPTEIRSLLFFEDWYLNKQTLAIKKEIKGIAPVRFYVRNMVNIEKEIPFVIWYHDLIK